MDDGAAGVFLGLGSNLGDRVKNILEAVRLLQEPEAVEVEAVSGLYETRPELFRAQPDFLNCAVGIRTSMSPRELLSHAKNIENRMGRKKTFRYGPRIIDIDILLYKNAIIRESELCVPHSRLAERLFVLFPLSEIAGGVMEPASGRRIEEILRARLITNR